MAFRKKLIVLYFPVLTDHNLSSTFAASDVDIETVFHLWKLVYVFDLFLCLCFTMVAVFFPPINMHKLFQLRVKYSRSN